jgi:hypothetical protein
MDGPNACLLPHPPHPLSPTSMSQSCLRTSAFGPPFARSSPLYLARRLPVLIKHLSSHSPYTPPSPSEPHRPDPASPFLPSNPTAPHSSFLTLPTLHACLTPSSHSHVSLARPERTAPRLRLFARPQQEISDCLPVHVKPRSLHMHLTALALVRANFSSQRPTRGPFPFILRSLMALFET